MTNQVYKFKNTGQLTNFDPKEIRIPAPLVQDDILDKSNYIPNAESIRKSVITGQGLAKTGLYDDDENMPSDTYVNFRSGKYDKAEISDIINDSSNKLSKEVSDMEQAQASDDSNTRVGDASSK